MSEPSNGVRRRSGFSMPELIVAMIIMAVGVLSVARTSVGVLRQMRDGNQSTLAAFVAQSRIEKMRGVSCGTLGNGTATTRGISESWTVQSISSRATKVTETVTYVPRAGASRSVSLTTVMPCA